MLPSVTQPAGRSNREAAYLRSVPAFLSLRFAVLVLFWMWAVGCWNFPSVFIRSYPVLSVLRKLLSVFCGFLQSFVYFAVSISPFRGLPSASLNGKEDTSANGKSPLSRRVLFFSAMSIFLGVFAFSAIATAADTTQPDSAQSKTDSTKPPSVSVAPLDASASRGISARDPSEYRANAKMNIGSSTRAVACLLIIPMTL